MSDGVDRDTANHGWRAWDAVQYESVSSAGCSGSGRDVRAPCPRGQ
jgi:hypothetical protein